MSDTKFNFHFTNIYIYVYIYKLRLYCYIISDYVLRPRMQNFDFILFFVALIPKYCVCICKNKCKEVT